VKTLIVEDSATLCEIYARYLDGSGLDVSSVQTLSAAQQQLIDSAPQLILLDIELPDGNGLDLLEDVKRLSPQPAVVVMTRTVLNMPSKQWAAVARISQQAVDAARCA